MTEFRMYPDGDVMKAGVGFLAEPGVLDMFGEERRIEIARGEYRERREAEEAAAERQEAEEARLWRLERAGVGRTHEAVTADAAAAMDAGDRKLARLERAMLDDAGEPVPEHLKGLDRWSLLREAQEQREADAATPASKADLARVEGKVTSANSKAAVAASDVGVLKQAWRLLLGRG